MCAVVVVLLSRGLLCPSHTVALLSYLCVRFFRFSFVVASYSSMLFDEVLALCAKYSLRCEWGEEEETKRK